VCVSDAVLFFFSSRRRHTRSKRDWSSDVCSSDLVKSYRMFDRWATDTLPLAGEYFRAITKDLMWDNKLYNDTMTVGGRPAKLARSEERRVGKEGRSRGSARHRKKKREIDGIDTRR